MSTSLDLSHLKEPDYVCESCLKGRIHNIFYRNALVDGAKPYKVIFSNVEGLMHNIRYNRARYFVTFLDAATKESKIYNIKYKSKVLAMFR
jgi:hypothetical protein